MAHRQSAAPAISTHGGAKAFSQAKLWLLTSQAKLWLLTKGSDLEGSDLEGQNPQQARV